MSSDRIAARHSFPVLLAGLLLATTTLLGACAQDFSGAPDVPSQDPTNSAVPGDADFQAPVVVLLEDENCFESMEFVGAGRDEMVFHFSCDPRSIDLEPGDVVVGVYDGGYLARVTEIEFGSDFLQLVTEFIPLAEAIGDAEFSVDVDEAGSRGMIDLSGKTLYSSDLHGVHIEAGFRRGYLSLRPETHFDAAMQWGKLRRFDAIVGVRADADFELYVAASGAHQVDQEIPLEEISIPFAFIVEGIPVAGRLQLEVFAHLVSQTTGYVDMSLGSYQGHWNWQMGGQYREDSGWQGVWNKNWQSELEGVQVVGDAGWRGRVEFSVRPSVKFYETVTVSGLGAAYLRANADPGCDGMDWSLRDGIRAEMALSVRWLDRFIPDMPLTVPMGMTENVVVENTIPWPGDLPSALIPGCGGSLPWSGESNLQPQTLSCGDTVSGNTADSGFATQELNAYSCNIGNYEAPEMVYAWTAPSTGEVTLRLVDATPTAVNHDLFALEGNATLSPSQLQGTCVGTGMNSLVFEAQAGQTYLLVVDGYHEDAGPYQVHLEC